jgi:hypothetical protein
MLTTRLRALGLTFVLCAAVPAAAQDVRLDAIRSADFAARTAVQTVYHNLKAAGYEWRWIRDEKMPEILVRAVQAIRRESAGMGRELVLKTFIPTYITSYYDAIERLNEENQVSCLDATYIGRTLVPFLLEVRDQLEGVALPELVAVVLEVRYPHTVCQTLAVCQETLSDRYFVVFNERLEPVRFYNVCIGAKY